jgi:hypothetical protein
MSRKGHAAASLDVYHEIADQAGASLVSKTGAKQVLGRKVAFEGKDHGTELRVSFAIRIEGSTMEELRSAHRTSR